MADFDLSKFQVSESTGIDALFKREAQLVTPTKLQRRIQIASLGDLSPFLRLSAETLIHRSERDLWSLKKESDGKYYVERLFDDNGEPLKG